MNNVDDEDDNGNNSENDDAVVLVDDDWLQGLIYLVGLTWMLFPWARQRCTESLFTLFESGQDKL